MKQIFKHIKGDKTIWAVVALLAISSFLPVYSVSTNLVYVGGKGSTFGHLIKHVFLLIIGFAVIYGVHKTPYKFFSGGSVLMLPVTIILLVITSLQGTIIEGANASRWIQIPLVGIGFQTSTLAGVVIMVYTARYLSINKDKKIVFKESLIKFWLPVAIILGLVLPSNFSTAAMMFFIILLVMFIGKYPLKYIANILGMAIVVFSFFVLIIKAFPNTMPKNRVDIWKNRVERFFNPKEEGYQVEKAKIAIATGQGLGLGFGKSVQKNFLPESSSDFIFAIIIEETGMIGALIVMFFYFLLLFRIVITAQKAKTVFASLLVIAVGLPIVIQALINMAVAVNLFPVTGQTLPLISKGGTSILMTCFALGMILSVSASKDDTEETILDDNPLDILSETID